MGELLEMFYVGLLMYFIYKLVTGLILPVSKASAQMREKMSEMQQEQIRKQNEYNASVNKTKFSEPAKPKEKNSKDDYIDFEEIK